MRRFADLYDALDSTTSTNAKVEAMVRYFRDAPPEDAAWALYFLTGRRLKRLLASKAARATGSQRADRHPRLALRRDATPSVGDLAEVIALLLDQHERPAAPEDMPLSWWLEERLLPLADWTPPSSASGSLALVAGAAAPRAVPPQQDAHRRAARGRLGHARGARARAGGGAASGHRVAPAHGRRGRPRAPSSSSSSPPDVSDGDRSRPYPFYLASPLEQPPESLGERDGLARRVEVGRHPRPAHPPRRAASTCGGAARSSSPSASPRSPRPPRALPDGTVLDGEVLASKTDGPLPFAALQRRIGRQKLTAEGARRGPGRVHGVRPARAGRARTCASCRCASGARGWRRCSQRQARFLVSPRCRRALVGGARRAAARVARAQRRGLHAQAARLPLPARPQARATGGSGRSTRSPSTRSCSTRSPDTAQRAALYTDYTFAVWNGEELRARGEGVLGADRRGDRRARPVDPRAHAREVRAVRAVEPEQVFELHFEGIAASPRHKSGVALRFPRIARWRTDKKPQDADSLESLKELLHAQHVSGPVRGEEPRPRHLWRTRGSARATARLVPAARAGRPTPSRSEAWAAYARGESGLIHVPTGAGKTYAAYIGPLADVAEGRPQGAADPLYHAARALCPATSSWPCSRPWHALDARHHRGEPHRGHLLLRAAAPARSGCPRSSSPRPSPSRCCSPTSAPRSSSPACAPSSWTSGTSCSAASAARRWSWPWRGCAASLPSVRTWALSATLANLDEAARRARGHPRRAHARRAPDLERPVEVETLLPDTVDASPGRATWASRMLPQVGATGWTRRSRRCSSPTRARRRSAGTEGSCASPGPSGGRARAAPRLHRPRGARARGATA